MYDQYKNNPRYSDPYKDYDYDNDGFPGEFIYGHEVCLDDDHMDELWKPIEDYPGYYISNKGRIYSTYKKRFVYGSIGKNGYVDLSLKSPSKKRGRDYMHRLVGKAFIPNPDNLPLVRHMDNDPSNNFVENLAWGTQGDNVKDCIDSGNFRYFTEEDVEAANAIRRTPIIATDLRTGVETEFISQQEASRSLGINQSDISSVARGKKRSANGYHFRYADDQNRIDISTYKYQRKNRPVKAIRLATGREIIFRNATQASEELGIHMSSISTILNGKTYQAKGFTFKYADEEGFDE